ncbi:MAG TPA: septal ring lytic transglycosylase RlpA family protein [Caldimonas sp.]|jgi:rare lipoprotein A
MACGIACGRASAHGSEAAGGSGGTRPAAAGAALAPDRSGKKRIGTASVYSHRFAGRTMADGTPMDPHDDNAASRTLPLGTKAKITNLETGRAATVTIQDRGPYAKGRIVDLSPATARKIGLTPKKGVAKVEVRPIDLPAPKEDANR